MKRRLLLAGVILAVICSPDLCAQKSAGGRPRSFRQEKTALKEQVPFRIMPEIDLERLHAEDRVNDRLKDIPWRFGESFDVNMNPENSGKWETGEGGKIWRVGITCRGARSVNLIFDQYRLPSGAELFIYSADRSAILGAFTSGNNQPDGYFATELIPAESVIIEYFEPFDTEFSGKLNIGRIIHGYRSIDSYTKSLGSSGACNVNANCPDGDPIHKEIRSTVLVILGDALCSGNLINNARNDGIPYLLSANHCYYTPGALVFRFNWESPDCDNPASAPDSSSLSGAVGRANYAPSDMWLVELYDTPTEDYDVYYAGWNRATITTLKEKVWCSHHPRGDIKKISWSADGAASSSLGGLPGSGSNYWRINSWSDGTTTEGGSSGAALLDADHRIIGQLYGGTAACGNTNPDWFGKFSISWTGGGTPSTRLSSWLDPDGTGIIAIDGYDPFPGSVDGGIRKILSPAESYETLDSISPALVLVNEGSDSLKSATVYYLLNGSDSTGVDWTGTLAYNEKDTVIFPKMAMREGFQSISAGLIVPGDLNLRNNHLEKSFNVARCESLTLPLAEGFDSLLISPCWYLSRENGTIADLNTVEEGVNPECMPNQGLRMIEFNSEKANVGASVRLETPSLSTIAMDSISLGFDWYHDNELSNAEDRLIVQYSFDAVRWMNVAEIKRYHESLSGWQRKEFLMPDTLDHKPRIHIGLKFISGNGHNCYLDSLVISATSIDEPYPEFLASERLVATGDTVVFSDNSVNGPFTLYEWDFGIGAIPATALGAGPHEVVYDSTGYKNISLTLDGMYTKTKPGYILVDDNVFYVPFNLYGEARFDDVYLNWCWRALTDGFESGDLRMWGNVIEGPGVVGEGGLPYWHVIQDPGTAFDGEYLAMTDWGYNLDTWLISPALEVTDYSEIVFHWQSSYYWHVLNDHGDLFVKVSTDKGASWNTLWTFGAIGEWENWVWYETSLDISAYAGNEVLIAFHLVANDNSEVLLDNITVDNVLKKDVENNRKIGAVSDVEYTSRSAGMIRSKMYAAPQKSATLLDYSIFRDGTEVGKSLTNSYIDESLAEGTYSYYVVANFTDPVYSTVPSDPVSVTVGPIGIPGPVMTGPPQLFPNPSAGVFELRADQEYMLRINDMSGRLVQEQKVNAGQNKIDMSGQPDGIYFLYLTGENQQVILKASVRSR